MLRTLFAIVSGLFAMMIVVTFTGLVNSRLFPLAEGGDPTASLAILPLVAKLMIVAGNCLGPMLGAAVAARLAERRWLVALLIGAAATALNFSNGLGVPYPVWMLWAVTLPPLPLAALAAYWLTPKTLPPPEVKVWPKNAKAD